MRAVLDSAWTLLTRAERSAFARLSVFRGGFTLAASEAVTGAGLETLRGLLIKSLLTREATGRYQVHELLRQYAAERLGDVPAEGEEARDRHCAYYAGLWQRQIGDIIWGDLRPALLDLENMRRTWRRAVVRRAIDHTLAITPALNNLYRRRRSSPGQRASCRRRSELGSATSPWVWCWPTRGSLQGWQDARRRARNW
jgi:hypothetical protein